MGQGTGGRGGKGAGTFRGMTCSTQLQPHVGRVSADVVLGHTQNKIIFYAVLVRGRTYTK